MTNRTLALIALASVVIAGAYSMVTHKDVVQIAVAAESPDAKDSAGNPYVPDECRRRISELEKSAKEAGYESEYIEGPTLRAFDAAAQKLFGPSVAFESNTVRVHIFTHEARPGVVIAESDAEGCIVYSFTGTKAALAGIKKAMENSKL